MRYFRIATGIIALSLVAATATASPGSFSGLTFVLPEPELPADPDPGKESTDLIEEPDPSPGTAETRPLSPEGLALPEIGLPDRSGQTANAGELIAAMVAGRATMSLQLDPGANPAVGPRAPVEPPAPAIQESPVIPVAPPRVVSMPPEGWTPQWPSVARESGGVVSERQVIAYYGHPNSTRMGILGELPIADMAADLLARASEYDEINGPIGVAPAFHIIYGTVWEDANIGILREPKLLEYIEYAQANGIIVFLDHQIGRFTVAEAIETMLPYLSYEHVHLAIDPEWATTSPGQVIGQIHADELNSAQETISNYLVANGITEPKMLVVHQFNWRMIADRDLVRTDYPGVQLIHNADGFGQPAEKIVSWEANVQAANMPLKGFKLFYPKSWRDGGYDDPLLSPIEVLQLEPVPVYIQYQ